MTHLVKEPAAKADNLNLVPRPTANGRRTDSCELPPQHTQTPKKNLSQQKQNSIIAQKSYFNEKIEENSA